MKALAKLAQAAFLAGLLCSCLSMKAKIALADSVIRYHNDGDAWNLVSGGMDPRYTYKLSGDTVRRVLNLQPPPAKVSTPFIKIPMTRKLVNDLNAESPIRWLQYYNSTKIKMRHMKSSENWAVSPPREFVRPGVPVPVDGGILLHDGLSEVEEIDIPENTPGGLVNRDPNNTILYICFDPENSSLSLPFREGQNQNYYLDAKEDENGKKTIWYGGKMYEIEYENCQLLIAYEEQSSGQNRASQEILRGRKVGGR